MLIDLNHILIEAAKKGNMVILKAALGKGADINAQDNSGMSALIYAQQNFYTQMANYLREKIKKTEGNLVDNHDQSVVNDESELKSTNDCNKPVELAQITDAGVYIDYNKDSNKSSQHQKDVENNTNVIRLYPEDSKAYFDSALGNIELGEYQRAINDFNKAIELNPKYAYAYFNRGYAYSQIKQYQQAIDDFNKAIELDPKITSVYNYRAYAYWGMEQYQKAIDDYSKSIELNPKNDLAYYNRGCAYYEIEKYMKAFDDFFQAGKLYVERKEKAKAQDCVYWMKEIDKYSWIVTELQKIVNKI